MAGDTTDDARAVPVSGATGFVGRRVVAAWRAQVRARRCAARTPARAQDLVADGVEVIGGDVLDAGGTEPRGAGAKAASAAAPAALWLRSPGGSLHVGPASVPTPGAGELVVRARAVAVNPIDALGGVARRVVLPWLRYPAVLGSDVAREVVAVGAGVEGIRAGDRVVGYAVGVERSRNSAAEGAFRTHVTLLRHLTAPIPGTMSFEQACVLPLALTTAGAGLFERDQLALRLPTAGASPSGEVVLVLGGATSVGMNAIQLAHRAGYTVVVTASVANTAALERLGASVVVDYHDADVVEQIVGHLAGRYLAGTLVLASGAVGQAVAIAAAPRVPGTRRVASAHPTPRTRVQGVLARRRAVHVTAIWGGRPKDTPVGPALWVGFLPGALATGRYLAAPGPVVVGHGLDTIPAALRRLRQGARAQKFVVSL